jgi:hypothetical protein
MAIATSRVRILETLVTRTRIPLIVILVLAALHAAPGVADTTREAVRDMQRRMDDTLLTARVKGALVNDPITRAHVITIETFQGIIQLSGFVSTAAEKARAGEVVAAVPGVLEVRNAIQVRQALADSGAERRDADQVARAAAAAGATNDPQLELQ